MWGFKTSVRQAMLAALLLAAHPGAANPRVEFDSLSGVINLTNVSDAIVRLALNDPDTVQLRLLNSASARSMSLAVQESGSSPVTAFRNSTGRYGTAFHLRAARFPCRRNSYSQHT